MEVPECNVCHVALDEDEHQPRHLGCSHDACITCVKALIKNGQLECPMCRTVMKAYTPDDFQINHGVVQVLRLFKSFNITEKTHMEKGATANIRENCGIHDQVVKKKCQSCNVLICVKCSDFHTHDIGCEVVEYNDFIMIAKKEHKDKVMHYSQSMKKNLKVLTTDLSELVSKKKAIEEQMETLKNSIEEGKKILIKFDATSATLDKANTSTDLDKSLHTYNELYKFSQIWCKKNSQTLFNLPEEMYAALDINGKNNHCKLTFKDDRLYLHCFRICDPDVIKSFKVYSYDLVLTWLPTLHDLLFLDLGICGQVEGRVIIRLLKGLPNFTKNIPRIFTGEEGQSLLNLKCGEQWCKFNLGINNVSSITNKLGNFSKDANAGHKAVLGSVIVKWDRDCISNILVFKDDSSFKYGSSDYVVGQVEEGLEIVKICRNHHNQKDVTVVDCGLVIKKDLLRKMPISLL